MTRVRAYTVQAGGKVLCGRGRGFAEAVATFGGRVLATGSTAEIAGLAGPGTTRIDLAGRLAVPGLNDAHQHMMSVGMGTFEVNLKRDDIRTVDDVLAAIKAKVDEVGPGNWVFGRGYDHFQLDVKRHPQREEPDLVAPEKIRKS